MENFQEEPKQKNNALWIIGGIILVILLASAAFVGGRMFNQQAEESENNSGFALLDNTELPEAAPETMGVVTVIDGDTLTISEFNMGDMVGAEGAGGVQVIEIEAGSEEDFDDLDLSSFIGADGPSLEIVITHDAKLFKDTTSMEGIMYDEADSGNFAELPEDFEITIEEGSAEEIVVNSMITVWGEKKGDRIIASVVLYQPPIQMPDFQFQNP